MNGKARKDYARATFEDRFQGRIREHLDREWECALSKYNATQYDPHVQALYFAATAGKSPRYAEALQDAALALCGSPFHRFDTRRWGEDALRYLEQFCEGGKS